MRKLHFYYTSLLVEVKGFEPLHTVPKTVALTVTLYLYLLSELVENLICFYCRSYQYLHAFL